MTFTNGVVIDDGAAIRTCVVVSSRAGGGAK